MMDTGCWLYIAAARQSEHQPRRGRPTRRLRSPLEQWSAVIAIWLNEIASSLLRGPSRLAKAGRRARTHRHRNCDGLWPGSDREPSFEPRRLSEYIDLSSI